MFCYAYKPDAKVCTLSPYAAVNCVGLSSDSCLSLWFTSLPRVSPDKKFRKQQPSRCNLIPKTSAPLPVKSILSSPSATGVQRGIRALRNSCRTGMSNLAQQCFPKRNGHIQPFRTRNRVESPDGPQAGCVNDPSAGSPTETLLRLILPLSDKVYETSRDNPLLEKRGPSHSPDHSIGRSDGRCVQRAGT